MMDKLFFEVDITDLGGNELIRFKQTRLPLVLYRLDRPDNDNYSPYNAVSDLKGSYVYFLLGTDSKDSFESIYIGQSGVRNKSSSILQRIKEHSTETWSSDWKVAFILTRIDMNLDETCLNYIENYYYQLVKNNHNYKLWNEVTPSGGHPTEAKESDLKEDILIWNYMFNIAGIYFNEKKPTPKIRQALSMVGLHQDSLDINGEIYNIHFYSYKTRSGGDARICKIDSFFKTKATKSANDYYLILKGSRLSDSYSLDAFNDANCKKAREYISKYCLDNGYLTEDIPVTSATSAATIIKGAHSSNMKGWNSIAGALTEEQRQYLASPPFLYIQHNEINAAVKKEGIRYMVLKGSHISYSVQRDRTDAQTIRYINERRRLEAEGIIKDSVFTQNYKFSSKSMAGGVILGKKMSANWRRYCDFGYEDIARRENS